MSHWKVKEKGAHRFIEAGNRAHEVEHVAQDPVQVALQAILCCCAWPVHHAVIQQGLLQQGVQVLAVRCNDCVQISGGLHQWYTVNAQDMPRTMQWGKTGQCIM